MVVGGLTLLLLGIVIGRVFGPEASTKDNGGELVASTAALLPESVSPLPTEAGVPQEEVNPPELIIEAEPAEPIAPPANATPAAEERKVAATETPATENSPATTLAPQPESTTETSSQTIDEALAVTSPPPAFSSTTIQPSPVSLEGKVATIKPPAATQVCEPAKKFKDRKLSTALTWAESVQEASEQAEETDKLVFLIHVSGNFEMPGFT